MKKVLILLIAILGYSVANAQYKVGDIYNQDGLKGLVVKVDESGQHGLIMSLDKFTGKWSSDNKAKYETNAFYEDDGEKNMKAIESYLAETENTEDLFPFYEWCRSKGEGWYAPALEEMKAIIATINGSVGKYDKDIYKKYDNIIKMNGGDGLFASIRMAGGKLPLNMLTSTEGNSGKVWFAICKPPIMAAPELVMVEYKKNWAQNMGSRAVHKF